jgi:tetratricopeptide (TPR) repeat protein
VEDAEAAIRARLELRGEDAEAGAAISVTTKSALSRTPSDPMTVRFWSYKDYLFGRLWLFLGNVDRAIGRFERAASRRSDWGQPLLRIALAYARTNSHSQALAAFRRAIEVDRLSVEHNPAAMRALATVFLRRADEVEDEGRHDIARGLIEEVTGLDLRRAPSALRFEVTRRYEAARRGMS